MVGSNKHRTFIYELLYSGFEEGIFHRESTSAQQTNSRNSWVINHVKKMITS